MYFLSRLFNFLSGIVTFNFAIEKTILFYVSCNCLLRPNHRVQHFYFADRIWEVKTPAIYGHDWIWLTVHRHFFQFTLMTCSSAWIVLADIPGNVTHKAYEVVIGENQQSRIVNPATGHILAKADTPDILSCTEFRAFWLSWYYIAPYRVIQVGTDDLFTNMFMEYKDPDSDYIHAISMTTTAQGEGDWIYTDDSGKTDI